MRIIIADDHKIVRRAALSIIRYEYPQAICEEAENGAEALRLVTERQPDLVILDLNMPVMGGLCAAMRIRERFEDLPILFLTLHTAPNFVDEMRDTRAQGYVPKDEAGLRLIPAIQALLDHKTYFPIDRRVLQIR